MPNFTRVESVGKEFNTNLPLSRHTQAALKTTPPLLRPVNWVLNRGYELSIPVMSVDLTPFVVRTRDTLWMAIGRTMRLHQPEETELVSGGMLAPLLQRLALGKEGTLWGRHTSSLFVPKAEDVPNMSLLLANDITAFVRSFGDGIECEHFRVFFRGDDVVGHAYQLEEERGGVAPPTAVLYDPDESAAEAFARIREYGLPQREED